jgi:hypothetical protein
MAMGDGGEEEASTLEAAGGSEAVSVRRWLEQFIMRPHPDLGRKGPICPFVEPALRQGAVSVVTCLVGPRPEVGSLAELVAAHARRFDQRPWPPSAPEGLRALVLLFPELRGQQARLVDRAHAVVKDEVVRRGLMVGQFHPRCDEPAARNERFFPMRSPVPLLVLRRLALHDILFLHQDPGWFSSYAAFFGAAYRRPSLIDPEYVRLFDKAAAAFGPGPPNRRG